MKNKTIGILGGGQLARMLLQSGQRLGMDVRVLSENSSDPAQQVSNDGTLASPKSTAALKKFTTQCDVITFESEFMDVDQLKSVKGKYYPKLPHMKSIQDRSTQKSWLDKFKVPTSAWADVKTNSDLNHAIQTIGLPLVLKQTRFGYDGKGTYILKTQKQVLQFTKNTLGTKGPFIAEKFIPFKRELAVIFFRNLKGDCTYLPLVESYQKEERCFWVMGPVKHTKKTALIKKFKTLLDKEKYVGTLAVELFDTGKELLVNELAPRVHNSGHYSQNACTLSQFDLHLMAVSNLSLPSPEILCKGFAMVNLIGSGKKTTKWTLAKDYSMHWYGKTENRPGRKMGHINTTANSPRLALKKGLNALKGIRL